MTRTRSIVWTLAFIAWILLAAALLRAADTRQREVHVATYSVNVHSTWDSRDIKFIDLRDVKGGSVLISGDHDLQVVKQLIRLNGRKVIMVIEEAPER